MNAPLLEAVHRALTGLEGEAPLSFALAGAAGLLLAFSPAALALAPVAAALVGTDPATTRRKAVGRSAALVLGTATTFGSYGLVFGWAGSALAPLFGRAGFAVVGVLLVGLGLAMLGVLRVPSPGMAPPLRPPRSALGAYALGLPFGLAGSTCPCAIPVVLSLLLYAGSLGSPWLGGALLFVFALARGWPVVLAGALTGSVRTLRRLAPVQAAMERGAGALLILLGAGSFAFWLAS